jgi:uncharacterized protein VirK/YbjX
MAAILLNPKRAQRLVPAGTPSRLSRIAAVVRQKFAEHGVPGLTEGFMRFCGVALTWGQHRAVVRVIESPATRVVSESYDRVPYRYTMPYLCTSLNWQERRAALKSHYAFVGSALMPTFSQQVLDDAVEVWRDDVASHSFSVSIQGLCLQTRHREGELTLCFKADGEAIYKLSFSFVEMAALGLPQAAERGCTRHAMYVGRVQGISGAMNRIRQATVELGDIAPADLLMSVLFGMAQSLNINTVIGVTDEGCVSQACIAKSGSSFSYAMFWDRFAGQAVRGDHTLIKLPMLEKPIEDIASKHRRRTLRKRDYKAAVVAQVAAAMRHFKV